MNKQSRGVGLKRQFLGLTMMTVMAIFVLDRKSVV